MAVKAKRRTVRDLVQQFEKPRPKLTPEQREQVAIALDINEKQSNPRKRLSAGMVCQLLKDDYGFEYERTALEKMVCEEFGRRSWATK